MDRAERNRIWRFFIDILCLNNLLVLIISSNGDSTSIQYSLLCRFYLIFIYGMFLIIALKTQGKIFNHRYFILIVFMFVGTFISYFLNKAGTIYETLILILSYMEIPIVFLLLNFVDEAALNRNGVRLITIIQVCFFAYRAFITPVYDFGTSALSMGYSNSNRTGIYLFVTMCLLSILFKKSYTLRKKIIPFAGMIVLSVIIPQTQSRTCTLCMVLLWLCLLFEERITINLNKKKLLILLALPIIYVIISLFYENLWLWNNTIIFGKPLDSGRDYIFNMCIEMLKGNWLFGNFAYSPLTNKHSVIMTVMTSFGLIGVFLFFAFYFCGYLHIMRTVENNPVARMAFLCTILIYISGSTEAAMFVNGVMFAGLFCPILLYTRYKADMDNCNRSIIRIKI